MEILSFAQVRKAQNERGVMPNNGGQDDNVLCEGWRVKGCDKR